MVFHISCCCFFSADQRSDANGPLASALPLLISNKYAYVPLYMYTRKVFIADLEETVGHRVESSFHELALEPAASDSAASAEAEIAGKEDPTPVSVESIAQMKDHVFQLGKIGIVQGCLVVPKKGLPKQASSQPIDASHRSDVLIIKKLTPEGAECTPFAPSGSKLPPPKKLTTSDLLNDWKVFKGTLQTPLENWRAMDPFASTSWSADEIKGFICASLRRLWPLHSESLDGIAVLQKPPAVQATRHFPAGALRLVPATQAIKSSPQKPAADDVGAVLLGELIEGLHFQLAPQFVPRLTDVKHAPWVAPFWTLWCAQKEHASGITPNMRLTRVEVCIELSVKSSKKTEATSVPRFFVEVPLMENSRAIKKGEFLIFSNTEPVEPPAKRAKATGSVKRID